MRSADESAGNRVTTIADISGVWHRSLIRWPDGRSDTTTSVRWLQTPTLFADLRQPAGRPGFSEPTCLRELTRPQVDWLAGQEGFAGELLFDGTFFEWRRQIDLQPAAGVPDAGRLRFEAETLVEEGREVPYVEHWHRLAKHATPGAGVRLRDVSSGLLGFIVRSENRFMYARERPVETTVRGRLIDCVAAAADLAAAQDCVDCEISYGAIESAGWRIERSSLPYKENRLLGLTAAESMDGRLRSADVGPAGAAHARVWQIVDVQGSIGELLAEP
jgi:hypothetical protein